MGRRTSRIRTRSTPSSNQISRRQNRARRRIRRKTRKNPRRQPSPDLPDTQNKPRLSWQNLKNPFNLLLICAWASLRLHFKVYIGITAFSNTHPQTVSQDYLGEILHERSTTTRWRRTAKRCRQRN